MDNFVTLDQLLQTMPADQQQFLSKVIKRDRKSDGTDKGIVRQMQNDICKKCHADYQVKFPGKAFNIKCRGIIDEQELLTKQAQMLELGENMDLDEIRDIYDAAHWVSKNIVVKNADGDFILMPLRWYQKEALGCTAMRKVDRWARGMGKSSTGIGEELHLAITRKKLEIMIVCPQQTQAEMWYQGILEQLENSPTLSGVLAQQKQSPYYYLRFHNGSVIKIFTAGSGSGKKGGATRGQSPRRIRLDEQDYLAEADYDAIMPLLRRFPELTFHGSSTPTGLRGMYYQMCRKMDEYKEFFYPITDHPDWSEDKRETYILEAKTMDRFIHEFLAEFGDPTAGIFKSAFVDRALQPHLRHAQVTADMNKRYVMGVDWNGKGTGTRIYVVEYDTNTRIRRAVDRAVIDDPTATTSLSIREIARLNKKWMCDHIYVDAGFGFAQDELIRGEGQLAGKSDVQGYKLKNINVIDFGGSLEFNKLVPNREAGERKKKDDEDELKRRTKPFMVEGCVMAFEEDLVQISTEDDSVLEAQLRGYRVKTWSSHGTPASYETDAESGDHDLDAFMLAMLGIEINYGLLRTRESVRRLAQIAHVSGWGIGPVFPTYAPAALPGLPPSGVEQSESTKEAVQRKTGTPARAMRPSRTEPGRRILHNGRGASIYGSGGNGGSRFGGRVPSRAGNFGSAGRTPMARPAGASPFHTIGQGIVFNR